MPIKIEIDSGEGLIYFRLIGRMSVDDFKNAVKNLEAHPDFRPTFNILFDLRQGDLASLKMEDMQLFMAESQRHLCDRMPNMKTACVAPSNVAYGKMRMYEAIRTYIPSKFFVFRGLEPALEWLKIDHDKE